MKVMLIEDEENKRKAIVRRLIEQGIAEDDIIHAKNMTDFSAGLGNEIGLFIIDFFVPSIEGAAASQNGIAILEAIIKSKNQKALLLAISSYPEEFDDLRVRYESYGCILSDFSQENVWHSTLDCLLTQLKRNLKFDFLIFCALHEERRPYIALTKGEDIIREGVDCYDIEINNKKGSIILLPQAGLVNAAVIAGVCIDRYKPSVVGMSGICGGFKERSQMGQLVISRMAYEYQSGKQAQGGFCHEPYQVQTDNETLCHLRALSRTEGLISKLEEGCPSPSISLPPIVGVFTSGSAVIADEDFLERIETSQRKVIALDMEVFSIYQAAWLSECKPSCICAKTVVDFCDNNKGDDLHSYGAYISAKFLMMAINDYFSRRL